MRKAIFYIIFLLAVTRPLSARACSTCACGDPTLTVDGMEKPYEGRLRLSLENIFTSEKFGTGIDHHEVWDDRFILGTSWTPADRFTLNLQVPFAIRHLRHFDGDPRERAIGLGDMEFTGRVTLLRDEASRHLAGVRLGVRLPTAIQHTHGDGTRYDVDAEPGQAQWAPAFGAWYGFYDFPWMVFTSANVMLPVGTGIDGFDGGRAVHGTVTGQYSVTKQFALQLGLDSRWSTHNRIAGTPDPDTGGFLLAVTPGVVVSPVEDLTLRAYVQLPAADNLNGVQKQGPAFAGAVIYDLQ